MMMRTVLILVTATAPLHAQQIRTRNGNLIASVEGRLQWFFKLVALFVEKVFFCEINNKLLLSIAS